MTETEARTPLSVAIAGVAGRMGRQLVGVAMDEGLIVAGGTEAAGKGPFDRDIGELAGRQALGVRPVTDPVAAAANADVWIDFTRPEATLAALNALKHTRVSGVVIGTTGMSAAEEKEVARAAEHLAIVKAGNFSVGINLLQALTRMAASRLGEGWDIEILETHHRRKVDAPSGTALMLGEAAAEGRGSALEDLRAAPYDGPDSGRVAGQIGFSVRRMGDVIGEHSVSIGSDREILTLGHQALDRAVFAHGALQAAAWVKGRGPGLYGMDDVLGLSGN
ncbi:MAG: 4-hydroxy-tetrahydrodipicolinate reductase [Alphaproteobacteria bacterium]|nr:4-hydroxy-tetrahydrodipicolinate reductase [Alphaproteobacteria bacterium]MBU2084384.1 4-hydroxy-tetrahydrodipicolinate reductase [Alphaproteobacteria bacterium]MBU2142392.1 4-hydroxy-tetrahydrodipicolinate reductase [Alphaproteobacteria bacterium]MBU2196879.1 4-hydroxy-tetrahydrodipicolinate reductase [Alphaproteobacteria bacterium]